MRLCTTSLSGLYDRISRSDWSQELMALVGRPYDLYRCLKLHGPAMCSQALWRGHVFSVIVAVHIGHVCLAAFRVRLTRQLKYHCHDCSKSHLIGVRSSPTSSLSSRIAMSPTFLDSCDDKEPAGIPKRYPQAKQVGKQSRCCSGTLPAKRRRPTTYPSSAARSGH